MSVARATGLNHVSIVARDLGESVAFWQDLLGAVTLPTPNFGCRVAWLQLGDRQLHLFETDDPPPLSGHFGIEVDDFQALYVETRRRGIYAGSFQLPDGGAQMYFNDPAGNRIEVDCPDASVLDSAVVDDLVPLPHPQTGDNLRATLFRSLV